MSLTKLRLFVGVVDQGVISLANLLIGLLLINFVSKADYGTYVIANSVILLLVGLSNGLINVVV